MPAHGRRGPLLLSTSSTLIQSIAFACALLLVYTALWQHTMGFRDQLKAKLGSLSDGASSQQQQPLQRPPPPIPHATRPGGAPASSAPSDRPFVVVSRGQLALEDGTPFRFAGLNAPELLDGHDFEVEDTFRTLLGFGRRVTRSYTLKIRGTSPHFGDVGHINGWDAQKGDWMYDEGCFVKVDHGAVRTSLWGLS